MNNIKRFTLIILCFLVVCFGANNAYCEDNKTITVDIGTKRIPAGTIISLKLLNPVGSALTQIGEQFDMVTIEDIKVGKSVVIPSGTFVRGIICNINPAKRLSRGAVIYLNFDHIVSPTGKQIPLTVGICNNKATTYDGGLGSKTSYKTATVKSAQTTANIVKTSANWGWETGDAALNGYPKYVLAPITTIVSLPVAGIYFLGSTVVNAVKKGDEITVNQSEILHLMLIKPLDVPIY